VWNPAKQEGVLKVEKLPALAADKSYQLWVVDPQYKDPVDGGVFTVDPQTGVAQIKFNGKRPIAGVAAFAVTLERKAACRRPRARSYCSASDRRDAAAESVGHPERSEDPRANGAPLFSAIPRQTQGRL